MQAVQTEADEYDCLPPMWGWRGRGDAEDDPMPVNNRVRLTAWLARHESELRKLREIEHRFATTRDPALLEDFTYKEEVRKAYTQEKLQNPVSLFDAAAFLADGKKQGFDAQQWLDLRIAIARELFPGIEIREVHLRSGEPRLAYIGVTTKELVGAVTLRLEQMELAGEIRRGVKALELQNPPRNSERGGGGRAR